VSAAIDAADRAYVVGLGARTAVGATALASAAAVRAAVAMFGEHPYIVDREGAPVLVARDAFLSPDAGEFDRFFTLAASAIREAVAPFSQTTRRIPLTVFMGFPPKRPGVPPDLAARLSAEIRAGLDKRFAVQDVKVFEDGHSAGLLALDAALRTIASGGAGLLLVGGVDSYIQPDTLEWLESHNQLHSEKNSWGFIPGEGAGFCLLASAETSRLMGLAPLAAVTSVALGREENLIKTDAVCLGRGLSQAIEAVARTLPDGARIDHMICDVNGEPYRSDELGYALVRAAASFAEPVKFLTPVDCWGDVGAASAPLFMILASVAARKGYAVGPRTLVWTSSETGCRGAALLRTHSSKGVH
jgi:3-oxoacyl-[acyl-carrier-protein] synthase-1